MVCKKIVVFHVLHIWNVYKYSDIIVLVEAWKYSSGGADNNYCIYDCIYCSLWNIMGIEEATT